MDKKQKRLEKALKLAGIDQDKFQDVLDLLSDDDDQVQGNEKEEVKEQDNTQEKVQEENKKEEPKVEEPKQEVKSNEIDIDAIADKLGLNDFKTIISDQAKKIDDLKKEVEKSKNVGANQRQQYDDSENEDYSFDNILNKLNNRR